MGTAFAPGQEVFLDDGRVCVYVASTDGEHVVRPIYTYEDEEPRLGKPMSVRDVFPTEPIAKYSDKIVALRTEEAALREKVRAARAESEAFAKEERDRRNRIAAHGHLKTLDDFLAGRITHAVCERNQSVTIQPFAALKEGREFNRYDRAIITLKESNRRDGSMAWGMEGVYAINDWCVSKEEAIAVAAERLAAQCEQARNPSRGTFVNPETVADNYQRLGLECPADILALATKRRIEAAEIAAGKAHAAAQLADKQLAIAKAAAAHPNHSEGAGE